MLESIVTIERGRRIGASESHGRKQRPRGPCDLLHDAALDFCFSPLGLLGFVVCCSASAAVAVAARRQWRSEGPPPPPARRKLDENGADPQVRQGVRLPQPLQPLPQVLSTPFPSCLSPSGQFNSNQIPHHPSVCSKELDLDPFHFAAGRSWSPSTVPSTDGKMGHFHRNQCVARFRCDAAHFTSVNVRD